MAHPKKARKSPFPAIAAGSWKGEIVGTAQAHFGQQTQPGAKPRSVEFSYMTLSAVLTMPDNSLTWPGVLFIMAPPRPEKRLERAGTLFAGSQLPGLMLSLDVTRPQYSDMLGMIAARRFRYFHFTIGEQAGASWPVRSWGMGTPAFPAARE